MPKLKGYDIDNFKNREIPLTDGIYERLSQSFHVVSDNEAGSHLRSEYTNEINYSHWLNAKLSLFALKYRGVNFDREKASKKTVVRVNPEMQSFYDPNLIHTFAKGCGSVKSTGPVNITFDSVLDAEKFHVRFRKFVDKLYEYYWETE